MTEKVFRVHRVKSRENLWIPKVCIFPLRCLENGDHARLENDCFYYNSAYYPLREAETQIKKASDEASLEDFSRLPLVLIGGGGGFWLLHFLRKFVEGSFFPSEDFSLVWVEYHPFLELFVENLRLFFESILSRGSWDFRKSLKIKEILEKIFIVPIPATPVNETESDLSHGEDTFFTLNKHGLLQATVFRITEQTFSESTAELFREKVDLEDLLARLKGAKLFLHPVAAKLSEFYQPVVSWISSRMPGVFRDGTSKRLSPRLEVALKYSLGKLPALIESGDKKPGKELLNLFLRKKFTSALLIAAGPTLDLLFYVYELFRRGKLPEEKMPAKRMLQMYASSKWAFLEEFLLRNDGSSESLFKSAIPPSPDPYALAASFKKVIESADVILMADASVPSFMLFLQENFPGVLSSEVPKIIFGVDPQEISLLSVRYMEALLSFYHTEEFQRLNNVSIVATTSSHPVFQQMADYVFSSSLTPQLDDLLGRIREVGFVGGYMLSFLKKAGFNRRISLIGFDFGFPWLCSHGWGYPFENLWFWNSDVLMGIEGYKRSPVYRKETFKNSMGYFTEPRLEFFKGEFEEVMFL